MHHFRYTNPWRKPPILVCVHMSGAKIVPHAVDGTAKVTNMIPEALTARGQQIRMKTRLLSAARVAFLPVVTLYAMFATRPREGHFLKYIADRRYFDNSFNELFPQPYRDVSGTATATTAQKNHKQSLPSSGISSMDDRQVRRARMFARENDVVNDTRDQISTMSVQEYRLELQRTERKLSIPEIMEQLRNIVVNHTGTIAGTSTSTALQLTFQERLFWSTAMMTIPTATSQQQQQPQVRRFAGVFNMMWFEY